MRQLSRKQFRSVLLAGAFLWFAALMMDWLDLFVGSEAVKTLLQWNYYDAIAPIRLISAIYWYSQLSHAAGLLGMFLFKAWGRSLVLFSLVMWWAAMPFVGTVIFEPVTATVSLISGNLITFALILSYFTPHSEYFKDGAPVTAGND